jgi:hypothetical protein
MPEKLALVPDALPNSPRVLVRCPTPEMALTMIFENPFHGTSLKGEPRISSNTIGFH